LLGSCEASVESIHPDRPQLGRVEGNERGGRREWHTRRRYGRDGSQGRRGWPCHCRARRDRGGCLRRRLGRCWAGVHRSKGSDERQAQASDEKNGDSRHVLGW
jgi:hypothetical protein